MKNILAQAKQLHQEGRFADAARRYAAVLEHDPNNADALHLFGILHYQNGYHDRAVELISRAIHLRPEVAAFHANLAEAYRAQGQYQQAIYCCQTALRLKPDCPEVINNLGLALHDLGRYEEAVSQFRSALDINAEFPLAQNNLGTSLLAMGRIGAALQAYRLAVALDPDLALARSNLGQMLVDQDQAEEGLPHCQEAVRLQPGVAAALNNLGNAYRAQERWLEAHAAYDEALLLANRDPKRPSELAQVFSNRGKALFLEKRREEAYLNLNRSVELAPDNAELWQNLANAYTTDDDHAAALSCWQRIVELHPDQAKGHHNLGWALQQEGRFAEAADCFRRALELDPHSIHAMLNQGGLNEELGDLAEAEACYRRAQSIYPYASLPLARLAMLLRGKLPVSDQAIIRSLLGMSEESSELCLPPRSPERNSLLFGLAQVLDAQGKYGETAKCLQQANAQAREQRIKEGKNYDSSNHSALVDRIIAGFTKPFFTRLTGFGDKTRRPVFVFGMPRSGTTLVEQVLASHSRVHGAGELRLAAKAFMSIPEVLSLPDKMLGCLEVLDQAAVKQLSQRYLDGLQMVTSCQPDRIVDKMPDNYLYLGLLAVLFPQASFIHVRRDLRDVAVSCWMTNFRSIRWANDREDLTRRCQDYCRLMQHWQSVLPVPMHEIIYEQLVDDFETQARCLLAACGLEWEPACGRFDRTTRPVRTASVTQVRQPLYRKSLARWKNYEVFLTDLFVGLADANNILSQS